MKTKLRKCYQLKTIKLIVGVNNLYPAIIGPLRLHIFFPTLLYMASLICDIDT